MGHACELSPLGSNILHDISENTQNNAVNLQISAGNMWASCVASYSAK